MDAEMDNHRAVFTWARDAGDATTAQRLAGAVMLPYWRHRGRADECLVWTERSPALVTSRTAAAWVVRNDLG
jgi:predicted ATPase